MRVMGWIIGSIAKDGGKTSGGVTKTELISCGSAFRWNWFPKLP